jgi:hypothetical protein
MEVKYRKGSRDPKVNEKDKINYILCSNHELISGMFFFSARRITRLKTSLKINLLPSVVASSFLKLKLFLEVQILQHKMIIISMKKGTLSLNLPKSRRDLASVGYSIQQDSSKPLQSHTSEIDELPPFLPPIHYRVRSYKTEDAYSFSLKFSWYSTCHRLATKRKPCACVGNRISKSTERRGVPDLIPTDVYRLFLMSTQPFPKCAPIIISIPWDETVQDLLYF